MKVRPPVTSVWFGTSLPLMALVAGAVAGGCSSAENDAPAPVPVASSPTGATPPPRSMDGILPASTEPTLRASVPPITRVEDALPRTFIPPFEDCRDPLPGQKGKGPGGKVCTNVAISGCTEEGKYFPDYASCAVVRTQRPYWPAKPAGTTAPDDPRLKDAAFQKELAWVTEQAQASGCTCCHDSRQAPKGPSQWGTDLGPIWTDSVSNSGIALFAGLVDSSVFGHYAPEKNNGFQRTETGIPSTDAARMRAFFKAELARRGVTDADLAKIPPFGGALAAAASRKPGPCTQGEGVDGSGVLRWDPTNKARYVFVLEADAPNPGAPPSNDLPVGLLWRLDALANAPPFESGVAYGATPKGSVQSFPLNGSAPVLRRGKTYHLLTWRDVGLVGTSCLFSVP